MARPPVSKSQKIRTGNYYLIWSGLKESKVHRILQRSTWKEQEIWMEYIQTSFTALLRPM